MGDDVVAQVLEHRHEREAVVQLCPEELLEYSSSKSPPAELREAVSTVEYRS